MAIKYKVIQQEVTTKSVEKEFRYYARACDRSRMDLEAISKIISRRSTLSPGDIQHVLTALTELIPELLIDNQSVHLGDLGTISLHLRSRGEDSPKGVTSRSITELRAAFRAGRKLKKGLTDARFVKKVSE